MTEPGLLLTRFDDAPVVRVPQLVDLPDESVLCLVRGHGWSDPPATPVTDGWHGAAVSELRFTCPCGRRKREVVDDDTGEVLTRAYGGGTMLATGGGHVTRAEARVEWIRRKRSTPPRKD